uniref:Aldehyde dehydrogenase domain-containing protein n=1 Tax=Guillardia theta TaxID=55529 RepID=A0A7S4PGT7_GUITH|mmetsp:Transcript_50296/g.157138  ORF Transcript_50296/g.157138 Transcript_50296/m.157138 type:complete len:361 (+) Transcript_50296:126-1208(+)
MSKGGNMEDLDVLVKKLRAKFETQETRGYSWRIAQMQGLRRMIMNHESEFLDALATDLRKPYMEGLAAETASMLGSIDYAIKNLKSYMKPQNIQPLALTYPSKTTVRYEPFGIVLIIGPFNFPFMLTLKPFLGAIMAGNCAVIKMSEYCPALTSALKKYFPMYLDTESCKIVEGGVKETEELLKRQWDFIFFTGSPRVGKIVAEAAAQHLTPYILELGGKNPVIVDKHVEDLEVVAKRLIWGRCYNSGQICLSPEYVLCHEDHVERLISLLAKYIRIFYGENPQESADFGRMVTKEAANRVKTLLGDRKNGKIEAGGKVDVEDRYVAPTILSDADFDSPIMKSETFAPVLTVNRIKRPGR